MHQLTPPAGVRHALLSATHFDTQSAEAQVTALGSKFMPPLLSRAFQKSSSARLSSVQPLFVVYMVVYVSNTLY